MVLHTPIEPAAAVRMGDLVRDFAWAATPLGPMDAWPDRLRAAVDLCLRSSVNSAVYWGPELTLIYNDGFMDVLGDRHPRVLGLPAREAWTDSWEWLGPQFEQVIQSGLGLAVSERMVPVVRGGLVEEIYWNYSLTPLTDADGIVRGILGQREDVTRAVLAERRLSFQVRLADSLRSCGDPEQAKQVATRLLGDHLGAARVGYAEIDEETGVARVHSDWTRDEGVGSLSGLSAPLADFGEQALSFLRSGEVLAIPDLRDLPLGDSALTAAWEKAGMRALVTVPLVRDGALKALLYVHEPQPRAWRRSEAAMVRDVAERTWAAVERAQAEQSLRDSEDHYRHTVELNPQVTWTALPDGRLNRISNRWAVWTGTSGLGASWIEAIHPQDRERSGTEWSRSVSQGEPYDIEHRVRMQDGAYRWARSRAWPRRRDDDGTICLWYGSTEDIHERKVAEEHQRLLINELNHRVKNSLATVQAIAFQTLKGDITLTEGRSRFESRLMALSRAHNLLTEQNWGRAALDRVVRDSTEHLSGEQGRFEIEGEPVWLTARAALALALALHELGTNAAKYGALSVEGGRVAIAWHREEGALRLNWKETGGPAVDGDPTRRGFGSRLIEQGLGPELEGRAELVFEPDGLRCRIAASEAAIAPAEGESG